MQLAIHKRFGSGNSHALVGQPGVGKTMLAQAIGYEAIKQSFVVAYRSIFDLVRDFLADDALQQRDPVLRHYIKPDLVIIDDMDLRAFLVAASSDSHWRKFLRNRLDPDQIQGARVAA